VYAHPHLQGAAHQRADGGVHIEGHRDNRAGVVGARHGHAADGHIVVADCLDLLNARAPPAGIHRRQPRERLGRGPGRLGQLAGSGRCSAEGAGRKMSIFVDQYRSVCRMAAA
jgi:hypothetical protein